MKKSNVEKVVYVFIKRLEKVLIQILSKITCFLKLFCLHG